MSVAEKQIPRIVSVDDAIEAVWELVYQEEEKSYTDAAYRLWPEFRLSQEAIQMLALEGFIHRCHNRQNEQRRSGYAPIGYGVPKGQAAWDKYLRVLATPYRGADGTKPLLEFTISDLAAWALNSRKMAASYTARADWASKVEELLSEHGAVKVGKLPKQVLSDLAAEFAEIVQTK